MQEKSSSDHEDFDFDSLGFDQMEIDHYLSFAMFDDDFEETELSMEPPPEDHPSVIAEKEFLEKSGGVFVKGSVKGEKMDIIPHGTEPTKMKASHIRQVQLHFTVDDDKIFRLYCRRLCEVYGTDNLTDTVFKALVNEAEKNGIDGYHLYKWTKATIEDESKDNQNSQLNLDKKVLSIENELKEIKEILKKTNLKF